MPAVVNASVTATVSIPTPAMATPGLSRSFNAETAMCAATSDDEQAVSVVMHGPVSPSVYDTRPDSTESAFAVPEYTEIVDDAPPHPPVAPVLPLAPRKKLRGAFASAERRLEPRQNTP